MRPDARLVLVGDPDQLASVEAGAVLGDLARAPGRPEPHLDAALAELGLPGGIVNGVVTLDHVGGSTATVAGVRAGRAGRRRRRGARAAARRHVTTCEFVETDRPPRRQAVRTDVVDAGVALAAAARRSDVAAALAALERHRLLCAHRRGPYGVTRWSREIERWLADAVPEVGEHDEWYPGRPVLVTANDYDIGLYNGDTGVVVATADGPRVAFPGPCPARPVPARGGRDRARDDRAPGPGQPVRPRDGRAAARRVAAAHPRAALHRRDPRADLVRVVGSEAAVRAAVGRPVSRASGLRHRLAR